MAHPVLPDWLWELIDRIDDYEDTHPALYAQHAGSDEWMPTPCLGERMLTIIPFDVMLAARVMQERNRTRDVTLKAAAWDDGFTACAHEHMKQRDDSTYALTRVNPHREGA